MERLGRVVSVPFRAYHRQLSAYPMTVKSLTSGFVLASADFLSQWLRRPRPTAASGASRSKCAQDDHGHEQHWWSRKQTLCMGLYGGLFVAPFCHTWYHVSGSHPLIDASILTVTLCVNCTDLGAHHSCAWSTNHAEQTSTGDLSSDHGSADRITRIRLRSLPFARPYCW